MFIAGKYELQTLEKEDARQIARITGFTDSYIYQVLDSRNPRRNPRITEVAEKYLDIKSKHTENLEKEIELLTAEFNQPAIAE